MLTDALKKYEKRTKEKKEVKTPKPKKDLIGILINLLIAIIIMSGLIFISTYFSDQIFSIIF